ncbi:hypothetical protein FISHEDRAFT_37544 [Fistulina hepatica ATCC 64428]|uniref:Uncharacterized protein n=1 Tax=Fistulina hepatica ATCC 64428 TaxID=1128425 RepID=A0A0D7AKA4_9AGAR|nr:hypothetical protein FISHEDRAFT_37544 [Fistulina hepatica ATCC 64428]
MSSSPSPPYVEQLPSEEELARNADLLIREYLPQQPEIPTGAERAILSLPFCIPQITSSANAPFARGTNDVLLDVLGLSETDWLRFLDGLNLAIVASPPLRIVNVAGMALGLVPYHWAILAGIALQVSSRTAMAVLSKTLTDRYLRAANLNLFHPHGLSARLVTTPALRHLLQGTELETPSKTKNTLKRVRLGVGGILLRLPVTGQIMRSVAGQPPRLGSQGTVLQRRLDLFEGYALPVNLNVPSPQPPTKAMDHIQEWSIKFDQGLQGWQEKRANKWRARAEQDRADREANPNGRAGRRARRDERRLLGPKGLKAERRAVNADLLEHWGNDMVVWLVVMTAEKDAQIEGIEKADSLDNEESVPRSAFEAQVQSEEKDEKEIFRATADVKEEERE